MAKIQSKSVASARLEERIEEWGLLKRGAVQMLFCGGESYESISQYAGCSASDLRRHFPNPPPVAMLEHYDATQVLGLFTEECVLSDLELISDMHRSEDPRGVRTIVRDDGTKVIERQELHRYLRGKALRILGYGAKD